MGTMLPAVGLVLATVAVTLLAVLAGALVLTLLDVRAAARRLSDTLERLTPPAEQALTHLRDVTKTAADATDQARRLGQQLAPLAGLANRYRGLLPALAGIVGAIAAARSVRGRKRGHGRKRVS